MPTFRTIPADQAPPPPSNTLRTPRMGIAVDPNFSAFVTRAVSTLPPPTNGRGLRNTGLTDALRKLAPGNALLVPVTEGTNWNAAQSRACGVARAAVPTARWHSRIDRAAKGIWVWKE